jgi:amino acid transporter
VIELTNCAIAHRYIIIVPNQLTAGALVLQFWVDRDRVNPGVWITVFLVVIIALNYFGIKLFGEVEFWLSSKFFVILSRRTKICFCLVPRSLY